MNFCSAIQFTFQLKAHSFSGWKFCGIFAVSQERKRLIEKGRQTVRETERKKEKKKERREWESVRVNERKRERELKKIENGRN